MKQARQFGGHFRAFLPDEMLENLPDIKNNRLSEDQQELINIIREGFNTLSEMQKRVILLMVDQNMSERKVAETLGIGYPTVLNHLKRARKKIKQYVMQNDVSSIYSTGLCKEKQSNEDAEDDTDTEDPS